MLAKVQPGKAPTEDKDSDQEGWSDDENPPPPTVVAQPRVTSVNTPTTGLKQPISRPPVFSRPPPIKKAVEMDTSNSPVTTDIEDESSKGRVSSMKFQTPINPMMARPNIPPISTNPAITKDIKTPKKDDEDVS